MKRIAQTRNPKTNRYVKIDRNKGMVIGHKISPGPYKNIPIIRKINKNRVEKYENTKNSKNIRT